MMKELNLENIQKLLNFIWQNPHLHNQTEYFCEISCCLAGWDVALKFPFTPHLRSQFRVSLLTADELFLGTVKQFPNEVKYAYSNPSSWSRRNNNLTNAEADLLFNCYTRKELHLAILKAFEQGRRLDLPSNESFSITSFSGDNLEKLYNVTYSVPAITTDDHSVFLALLEFFNEEYYHLVKFVNN